MKKIFNIMMLALMVMFASCSSDDELTDISNARGEEIIINAGISDTRVIINGYNVTWDFRDNLTLIGYDAQGNYLGQTTKFFYLSGEDTKSAQFKGFLIPGAAKYKVVLNCIYLNVNADGTASISESFINRHRQYSINNMIDLQNVLIFESDGFKTAEDLKAGITMKMRESIMRVDLRSLPEGCNTNGCIKMFANYGTTDQVLMGKCLFDDISTLTNLTDANQHNYIYIPFDPMTLQNGKKLTLQFSTDEDETSVFGSVSRAASADMVYVGGAMYDLVVESANSGAYTNSMYEWKQGKITEPASNEIWFKYAEGAKKLENIVDFHNVDYTVSAEPNYLGWYVCSTANTIVNPQDLFNGNNIGKEIVTEAWLPETLTTITNSMFAFNRSVTHVKFSPRLEKIDVFAFYSAISVKDFVLPKTLKVLEDLCLGTYCADGKPNTLTILSNKATLTSIHSRIIDSPNLASCCDLRIHESWRENCNGNVWTYDAFDGGQTSYTFKSIAFVNDNGDIVP